MSALTRNVLPFLVAGATMFFAPSCNKPSNNNVTPGKQGGEQPQTEQPTTNKTQFRGNALKVTFKPTALGNSSEMLVFYKDVDNSYYQIKYTTTINTNADAAITTSNYFVNPGTQYSRQSERYYAVSNFSSNKITCKSGELKDFLDTDISINSDAVVYISENDAANPDQYYTSKEKADARLENIVKNLNDRKYVIRSYEKVSDNSVALVLQGP